MRISGLVGGCLLHELMELLRLPTADLGLVGLADHLGVGARDFILLLGKFTLGFVDSATLGRILHQLLLEVDERCRFRQLPVVD